MLSELTDPLAISIVTGIDTNRLHSILYRSARPSEAEAQRLIALIALYRRAVKQVNAESLRVRLLSSYFHSVSGYCPDVQYRMQLEPISCGPPLSVDEVK